MKNFLNWAYGILMKIKNQAPFITALASVVIAAASVYFTTSESDKALAKMDLDMRLSNKPIVIVSQNAVGDSSEIILWNSGPGTAYDINVEIHLAFSGNGDVGNPWVSDVIKSAIELETKTSKELNYSNLSNSIRFSNNHPPILPYGIEYGYKSSLKKGYLLSGLFIIIKYSDALGNDYYSIWDGLIWNLGQGQLISISKNSFDPSLVDSYYGLISHDLLGSNKSIKSFPKWRNETINMPYAEWLCKQAYFYKKNGLGDINFELQPYLIEIDTTQSFIKIDTATVIKN